MMDRQSIDTLAYRFAEITQGLYEQGNAMAYVALLMGIGALKLETSPGTGHNFVAVIDGIHDFQAKNRSRNVAEGYEQGLRRLVTLVIAQNAAVNVVNIVAYELKYERDHRLSFRLDMDAIIDSLSETLSANRERILQSGGIPQFDEWMNGQKAYLAANFGQALRW